MTDVTWYRFRARRARTMHCARACVRSSLSSHFVRGMQAQGLQTGSLTDCATLTLSHT